MKTTKTLKSWGSSVVITFSSEELEILMADSGDTVELDVVCVKKGEGNGTRKN